MAEPMELARGRVADLVERFRSQLESYRSSGYHETEVRVEYIDPFFEALGWDVHNHSGYAEPYKDVVHEESMRAAAGIEAPDYTFRIGGTRKFFVEAKKPAVNVKADAGPAYQLRRYAWSGKLPLSILTDFEEFAVYDCTRRPGPGDAAGIGRTQFLTCDLYPERWPELWSLFAKDSVLRGSLDSYVRGSKRGTNPVDREILKEIEAWREELARNLALRNPQLSVDELNQAVQVTIDRILFLRVAEDRGSEEYGRLLALLNGANVYPRLAELYRLADLKYNAGLFNLKADRLTPGLTLDDKVVKDIINGLYYPQSPYEFNMIAGDILGQVYEQFLGKVIRLTPAHRAVVEEKPEVKKAGGVYYTPTYIVDYIVEHTVGELIKGKSPEQIDKLRVLDPACGSGSFLLGAYQHLLDYHLDWYTNHDPEQWAAAKKPPLRRVSQDEWRLTTAEKKRILLNNIYGVDIDRQAVEVTKLNLLLKVLEGENDETLGQQLKLWQERALPDLGRNVKCGNSLIGPDYWQGKQMALFDPDEVRRVNAFDWQAEFPEVFKDGGFDAVIGNPPYGAELQEMERPFLSSQFDIGSTDTAALFMEQQRRLLRQEGMGGFIVPKAFTYASNWRTLADRILPEITHMLDGRRVWSEVLLEMVVYILVKGVHSKDYLSAVLDHQAARDVGRIDKKDCTMFGFILNGISDAELSIGVKMYGIGAFWGDLATNRRGAPLQGLVGTVGAVRAMGGAQIQRYGLASKEKGRIAKGDADDERAKVAPEAILAQNIVAHIENPTPHVKIIATLAPTDTAQLAILDTVNQMTPVQGASSRFLLGVLNSRLVSWYVYRFLFARAIRTMHFDAPITDRIPIRTIDFSDPADAARHARMVELVNRMLELHQRLAAARTEADRELYSRQVAATDREIDALVYELYGLTQEEIKIVEGEGSSQGS